MSGLRVVRADNPAEFFNRCRAFLMAAEAEHNLILGLADALVSGGHDFAEPIYLAWAEARGDVQGIAFRTPPFKVGVSRLPLAAIPLLAADLAEVFESLPAVMGPEASARALAEAWATPRGLAARPGMRLRIHELKSVRDLGPGALGQMRPATMADQALAAAWIGAFADETRIPGSDPEQAAVRLIEDDRLRVWDDQGLVSMAAISGATDTAARVGYVYTPPECRGRGYATALVADLSREILASGRRSAFLYTDLANPISNRIYARIGYEPISDVIDVAIGPTRAS